MARADFTDDVQPLEQTEIGWSPASAPSLYSAVKPSAKTLVDAAVYNTISCSSNSGSSSSGEDTAYAVDQQCSDSHSIEHDAEATIHTSGILHVSNSIQETNERKYGQTDRRQESNLVHFSLRM